MFSTTIRQSVATLGVVAGLLAVAGPASAQILDGPVLVKGAAFRGEVTGLEPTVKAPAGATPAGISGEEMANAVKAPAGPTSVVFTSVSNVAPLHGDATAIWVWHEAARNGLAHGFIFDLGL
jgi:hypothetical protein